MRRGVTLIELLITMAIMAIISAAILGTASSAMEAARRDRTRVLITKISNLITERLASYETRRADVHPDIENALNAWVAAAPAAEFAARNAARGLMMADARLLAVRELMKKEMPDRVEDIQHAPLMLQDSPSAAKTYFRRYTAAQGDANDSAECLYMTVMNVTGDGEARTLFAKQDIGDTDEDGAREFIDGWGQPISWIRWPAGVVSDLQPLLPPSASNPQPTRADHDPLDQFRRDLPTITGPAPTLYPPSLKATYEANIRNRLTSTAPIAQKQAFRMVPLIYSAGTDGSSAMKRPKPGEVVAKPLDPYLLADDGLQAGAPDPTAEGSVKDNITNHLIEY